MARLDADTLEMVMSTLAKYADKSLPANFLLDLDRNDEFPQKVLAELNDPMKFGLHLLFIPEEYGGLGGGAYDIYRVSEIMAGIDLGIATSVLATFLGADPIRVGGTGAQKAYWLGRMAEEGLLVAYGATEPQAGSDGRAAGTLCRSWRTARSPATASAGANSGSATEASPRSTPSWRWPQAAHPGSSSAQAPMASARTSPKTSTASAPATPRPSSWKMSM